jgi:predicted DNA-binding mobile mystery protein A
MYINRLTFVSIKQVILRQYHDNVNYARKQMQGVSLPGEGWIRTVRKALGMSGTQLARRLNVTRAQVSNTEKAELEGRVTLKTMQHMAEAMNSRFVYAIVPEHTVEKTLKKRALKKALAQVKAASVHMALEDQLLNDKQLQHQMQDIAAELLEKNISKLWNDDE